MKAIHLFLFLIILSSSLFAKKEQNLPKLLSANNSGKDFWFTIPPGYQKNSSAQNNFIKIYVTCSVKTLITMALPSQGIIQQKNSIPYGIIEFTLSPEIAQPYIVTGKTAEVVEQVYVGAGIHVYADYPIVVYCMPFYGGYGEGFLAIPTFSLGYDYITSTYNTDPMFSSDFGFHFPAICGIVAAYNDTKLKFTMGGNPNTSTAGGLRPGQAKSFTLNKGDVFMVSSKGDYGDLAGSRIFATKPVAVISGSSFNNIPVGNQAGNYSCEMEMPVFTWGKYYHVTITPGLSKSSSIRVFAKESNTTIFRDGKQVSFVKTYGGIIGEGYQELQITPPESPMKPVVISGDKPINIMLYNTGYKDDVNPLNNSRPFWMAQVPIEQYQKEITFFPPPVIESSGKMNHYLKLICQLDSTGNIPDDMQFGEPDSGKILWSQYNRKFPGQIDTFAYDIYGKKFGVQILPLLKSGVFKIKSPKAFIAYSFGNDTVKSYGFPSATGLMDLSRDDLFPPVPKFKLLCNGSLEGGLGTVTDMPDNDSIRSNLSVVTYLKDESYNYSFTFKDFVPGESRTTSWSIEPYDMSKDARAVITFTDRRGNDTTIIIEYKSLKLSITPNNFDFGRVKFGSEQTQTFQIKNESDDKVRVTQISMASNGKQNFEIVNNPVPFSLGQLESRTFSLKFKSLKEGDDFRDSIRIGDSCRLFPAALVKAKVGFPIIIVGENPNEKCDMDFNKIFTNEINRKSIQILNLGSSSMELSRIKGPFSQNFRAINISNFPIRIEPGNSIQMDVEFQSESEGKFRDSIIFSSDATNIDSVATLCAEAVISDVKENITKDNYTISIYPNPVIDEGIIKLRTDGLPHGIYISDIFGRRIQEIDFTNANSSEGAIYRFDASQLAQGLYFLNVSDGGRVVVRKFIIGR